MLGFLFRGLTAEPDRGAALFAAITAEARKPHWYVDGAVPDTLDGRFAVLANVAALAIVRLEALGNDGNLASVALTERFIEVMESEHREMGIGDPTLGKKVRKLVSALARRVDLWRDAEPGTENWKQAVRESLYTATEAPPAAVAHSAAALAEFQQRIARKTVETIAAGRLS